MKIGLCYTRDCLVNGEIKTVLVNIITPKIDKEQEEVAEICVQLTGGRGYTKNRKLDRFRESRHS